MADDSNPLMVEDPEENGEPQVTDARSTVLTVCLDATYSGLAAICRCLATIVRCVVSEFGSLYPTCVSFFTLGKHKRLSEDDRGIVVRQDGYIASWMFGLLLAAFLFVVTLSRRLSLQQKYPVEEYFKQIVLIVVMGIGIVGLLAATCSDAVQRRISKTDDDDNSQNNANIPSHVKWHYSVPLVGLALFLAGIFAMDVLKLIAYSACLKADPHDYGPGRAVAGMFYHLFKCIFCLTILLFLFVYRNPRRHLYGISHVRYFFALVAAAILFLYFDLEVLHSYESTSAHEYCSKAARKLTLAQNCFCLKTSEFKSALGAGAYLSPFYIEFFLLATERLLLMFNNMRHDRQDRAEVIQEHPDVRLDQHDGRQDHRDVGQDQPEVRQDHHDARLDSQQLAEPNEVHIPFTCSKHFAVVPSIGLIIAVVYMTLTFSLKWCLTRDKTRHVNLVLSV